MVFDIRYWPNKESRGMSKEQTTHGFRTLLFHDLIVSHSLFVFVIQDIVLSCARSLTAIQFDLHLFRCSRFEYSHRFDFNSRLFSHLFFSFVLFSFILLFACTSFTAVRPVVAFSACKVCTQINCRFILEVQ